MASAFKTRSTEATGYLIDHTAKVLVIDRRGDLRMFFLSGDIGSGGRSALYAFVVAMRIVGDFSTR